MAGPHEQSPRACVRDPFAQRQKADKRSHSRQSARQPALKMSTYPSEEWDHMARPLPIAVFEDNIADAELLLGLARTLTNTRKRRMRPELQERVGDAMKVSKRRRSQLDCVESDHVFMILKPGGGTRRRALYGAAAAATTPAIDRGRRRGS